MIDLKKFCKKSNYFGTETLAEPFTEGDYIYAADGSILIRVDKIPEITKTYPSIKAKQILEENKIDGNEIWLNLPKFEITERNCGECKGTGKVLVCKECNGTGSLEFSSDYNDYDVECKSCFGEDTVSQKCENCEGTGKNKEYSNPIVEVPVIKDGSLEQIKIIINGMYLEMIQDLPNIKMAMQDNSLKPIKLKFDGGIGIVMPIENQKPIS